MAAFPLPDTGRPAPQTQEAPPEDPKVIDLSKAVGASLRLPGQPEQRDDTGKLMTMTGARVRLPASPKYNFISGTADRPVIIEDVVFPVRSEGDLARIRKLGKIKFTGARKYTGKLGSGGSVFLDFGDELRSRRLDLAEKYPAEPDDVSRPTDKLMRLRGIAFDDTKAKAWFGAYRDRTYAFLDVLQEEEEKAVIEAKRNKSNPSVPDAKVHGMGVKPTQGGVSQELTAKEIARVEATLSGMSSSPAKSPPKATLPSSSIASVSAPPESSPPPKKFRWPFGK